MFRKNFKKVLTTEQFIQAAADGDLDTIKEALEIYAGDKKKIDAKIDATINSITALAMALLYDHHEIVAELLCHGADPNKRITMGNHELMPLATPINSGNFINASILLAYGANPDECSWSPPALTPLILSCFKDNLTMAKLLLQYNAAVNQAIRLPEFPSVDVTALPYAVGVSTPAMIKLLVSAGATIDLASPQQQDALRTARADGKTENVTCIEQLAKEEAEEKEKADIELATKNSLLLFKAPSDAKNQEAQSQQQSTLMKRRRNG